MQKRGCRFKPSETHVSLRKTLCIKIINGLLKGCKFHRLYEVQKNWIFFLYFPFPDKWDTTYLASRNDFRLCICSLFYVKSEFFNVQPHPRSVTTYTPEILSARYMYHTDKRVRFDKTFRFDIFTLVRWVTLLPEVWRRRIIIVASASSLKVCCDMCATTWRHLTVEPSDEDHFQRSLHRNGRSDNT